MNTRKVTTRSGANLTAAWWDEIEGMDADVDLRNVRGMTRTLRRGLVAARDDIRTSRGNKRYTRHG
jgi:hypothetical protein